MELDANEVIGANGEVYVEKGNTIYCVPPKVITTKDLCLTYRVYDKWFNDTFLKYFGQTIYPRFGKYKNRDVVLINNLTFSNGIKFVDMDKYHSEAWESLCTKVTDGLQKYKTLEMVLSNEPEVRKEFIRIVELVSNEPSISN